MTEAEAVELIENGCRTSDLEGNGCLLDSIISKFLEDNGYWELADAMRGVNCWRA